MNLQSAYAVINLENTQSRKAAEVLQKHGLIIVSHDQPAVFRPCGISLGIFEPSSLEFKFPNKYLRVLRSMDPDQIPQEFRSCDCGFALHPKKDIPEVVILQAVEEELKRAGAIIPASLMLEARRMNAKIQQKRMWEKYKRRGHQMPSLPYSD